MSMNHFWLIFTSSMFWLYLYIYIYWMFIATTGVGWRLHRTKTPPSCYKLVNNNFSRTHSAHAVRPPHGEFNEPSRQQSVMFNIAPASSLIMPHGHVLIRVHVIAMRSRLLLGPTMWQCSSRAIGAYIVLCRFREDTHQHCFCSFCVLLWF